MSYKIKCPICGRILGDTNKSLDGITLNCRGCKKQVKIDIKIYKYGDYPKKGGQ